MGACRVAGSFFSTTASFISEEQQMGKKRHFYRTVIEVEILSGFRITPRMDIEDLVYEFTYGECSGQMKYHPSEKVDRQTIVKLLEAQGSDGDFLKSVGGFAIASNSGNCDSRIVNGRCLATGIGGVVTAFGSHIKNT
jgi:hypothetical protein